MAIRGESVQLGPWSGGVNYAIPAEDLGPNDLFEMENVRVGRGGECKKRGGTDTHNTSQIGGSPTATLCVQHRFSATSEVGYSILGAAIYEDNLSGAFTARTGSTTITAGDDNTFVHANFNGDFYATNGVSGDTILRVTSAGANAAAADVDSRFSTAKTVEPFDNRLFWGNLSSGVDRVWRSDSADATTYGANAFYQLGDDVTGLGKIGNALAAHTQDAIFLLVPTGNAAIPYKLIQRANAGTITERGVVTVQIPGAGEVQIYIRKDGIYLFDGNSAQKISWKLDGTRYWDSINQGRLHKAFCYIYPKENEIQFWLPYGESQTTMNHCMCYDYIRNVWYGPFTGVTRNCGSLINDVPHCGGHSIGYIYKHEQANLYDDTGAAQSGIDSFFETSSPSPHGTDVMLRWLFLRTSYDVLGAYDILVTYTSPGIVGESTTLTVTGGFDAIETAFKVASSAIATDGSLASADTDLQGYDPNVKIKYTNSAASEDFRIRRAMAVFKGLGRVRKPGPGVN